MENEQNTDRVTQAQAARKEDLKSSTMGVGMNAIPAKEVALFTDDDVRAGVFLFDAYPMGKRQEAMRAVMMHALKCAAINLDVKP